jgi:DTW domain-containing protein YfiP
MSRQICKHCGFIISDCICDSISAVENQTQIIVLQHKSEANHSKNTIRIAELIYNNITVVVG